MSRRKLEKIGIVLFLIGFAFPTFAQDNKGFTPPGKTFGSNPFVPQNNDEEEFFDEEDDFEEDEFDDIAEDVLRKKMEQRLRERAKALREGKNQKQAQAPADPRDRNERRDPPRRSDPPRKAPRRPAPTKSPPPRADFKAISDSVGNTSIQQGANAKITPGPKNAGCLALDPNTGYGPDIIKNFDFPDADIVEIAKTLGRLTCLNFIFDKDVRGKISIVSNAPITVGDAWKAFLTALDVNGYSLIPSGSYIRIARQRDAKDKQIKTYSGKFTPDGDMYITRVLPLSHISAQEVARVFRNFMPPNTRILSYDQTNTLILTDTAANIKKLSDMIAHLDVAGHLETLEVIRIRNASALDIAKLIDKLLPDKSRNRKSRPGIPRFRGSFASRRTKDGGLIAHIIADDRTNSIIVSANAKGHEQVRTLVKKLDTKVPISAAGSRIHVVYLQFAEAEQVAQTLSNLASSVRKPTSGKGKSSPLQAALFEGSIKVSPDKATNSLVITATATDFGTIQRVINKLDIPRDQVFVEAVIMEITLDNTFELGASVFHKPSGTGFVPNGDLATVLTNPAGVQGTFWNFRAGSKHTLSFGGTDVEINSLTGLLKAIQTNTNANVLSTPQILTLDNQEATIEVAENIPIRTTTAVQGAGTQSSISRDKVSLTLTVKPQINKVSDFVKLDIKLKSEDISGRAPPSGVADDAFATTSRNSTTTVVVQDSDTVVIGGLMREKVQEASTKVPLLGDIPLLGWLFRSKKEQTVKQNLVAFITPRIIKQYKKIRAVLDRKIRERDEFIERNAGGRDKFQEHKLKLVKDLPLESELKNWNKAESGVAAENPEDRRRRLQRMRKQIEESSSSAEKTESIESTELENPYEEEPQQSAKVDANALTGPSDAVDGPSTENTPQQEVNVREETLKNEGEAKANE